MRIEQVRFKNLNSLVGEWVIDFTHPAFISDGVFAITGATGAGKSTILDAICLALYGATPRLNKISESSNEIMSRHTGECFAEVTFVSQKGHFRCHWSQHRARRSAAGKLQPPKHEIADANTGRVIESKIRTVAAKIEEKTGMDFDRFTRSMLLAQGGFAAFLQASADERAPILEQITGTEIYSQISVRTHERYQQAQQQLSLLQAEVAGIKVLSADEVSALTQDLSLQQQKAQALTAQHEKTTQAITWLKGIASLNAQLVQLDEETQQLQAEEVAFAPKQQQLDDALRAATLDGDFATLSALRQQQLNDEDKLANARQQLPLLKTDVDQQTAQQREAEAQTQQARDKLEAALPIIRQVRALDQSIADKRQNIQQIHTDISDRRATIDNAQYIINTAQDNKQQAQEDLHKAKRYGKVHEHDAWLVSGLAGVTARLQALQALQRGIKDKAVSLAKAQEKCNAASKQLLIHKATSAEQQRTLDDVNKQLHSTQQALATLLNGRLLRECRSEKEHLLRERAFMRQIVDLEAQRAQLQDGLPCPLCGSEVHPFAQGNIPSVDATDSAIEALSDLISKAEAHEAKIQQLNDERQQALGAINSAKEREQESAYQYKSAGQQADALAADIATQQDDFNEQLHHIAEMLRPLGIDEIDAAKIAELIEVLENRLQSWQAHLVQQEKAEQQLMTINSELEKQRAILAMHQQGLLDTEAQLKQKKEALNSVLAERETLFSDKQPDHEEQHLYKAIEFCERVAREKQELFQQKKQALSRVEMSIEALEQQLAQRQPKLVQQQQMFEAQLKEVNFIDETHFQAARLPLERRNELMKEATLLAQRRTQLSIKHQDCTQRLKDEKARALGDANLVELEAQASEEAAALQVLRTDIARIEYQCKANEEARQRIKTQQGAIDAQQLECQKWTNLQQLIGSANGKKYRNFAQGLTFGMMVSYANQQLQKMTDRYLLLRDIAQPLELNVIDNYQAGEVRSTKNLSGGESFIISLALALGLSHMASQNVRVDSLFLDEGFGTLDEEALDTALETLSSLQQEGKLIGIISHIPALKERIGTQIQIIRQNGGRSRIIGPGCESIKNPA